MNPHALNLILEGPLGPCTWFWTKAVWHSSRFFFLTSLLLASENVSVCFRCPFINFNNKPHPRGKKKDLEDPKGSNPHKIEPLWHATQNKICDMRSKLPVGKTQHLPATL